MEHRRTGCEDERDIAYMQALDERLEKNPHDVQALIEQGFLFVSPFYREQEGIELLERAMKLAPTNLDAYFWLAMGLYQGVCDSEQAERILRKALEIDSSRADCLTLLAQLVDDEEQSIMLLRRAVQSKPDFLFTHLRFADRLLKANKIDEAEQEAKKMLKTYNNLIFPKTNSAFEDYYEGFTGRYPGFKEKIDDFFLEINEKRKEFHGAQKK